LDISQKLSEEPMIFPSTISKPGYNIIKINIIVLKIYLSTKTIRLITLIGVNTIINNRKVQYKNITHILVQLSNCN